MNDRMIMLRDILAKFNMYHDRRGRFAHAPDRGGAGAASASPKQQKRINEFKKKLRAGEINTKLRYKDGINKHDPGSVEYGKYKQLRAVQGKKPPSCFTVKPDSLYDEIKRKLARKDLDVSEKAPGEYHARIPFDKAIGVSYDVKGNKRDENTVTVVFSERYGLHYYPGEDD